MNAGNTQSGRHLILYDGVCGLCNRLNRFVLPRDRDGAFRFASLQSAYGRRFLGRFGRDAADLNTFYVIENFESDGATLLEKTYAAFFVLKVIGGLWRVLTVLRVLPLRLLNWGYDLIARSRYRVFGRYESCPLPRAEYKDRFIEI